MWILGVRSAFKSSSFIQQILSTSYVPVTVLAPAGLDKDAALGQPVF